MQSAKWFIIGFEDQTVQNCIDKGKKMLGQNRWLKFLVLFFVFFIWHGSALFGYTPWEDNGTYVPELGKVKVRTGFSIKSIDVIPITQMNCIFREMEENPTAQTSQIYRQPHCASLRNQRIFNSENWNMPSEAKQRRDNKAYL